MNLPKSILKKTVSSSGATRPRPPPEKVPVEPPPDDRDSKHDRNMAIALLHANRIQQHKDFEKTILHASFKLLELPRVSGADPSRPSEIDAAEFKKLVENFRPRDYDDLIEERNASDQCGYVLCPRQRTKAKGDGKYTLVFSKDSGMKSVEKKELEQWCSPDCARRALYVKVQLLEETALAGPGTRSEPIVLLVETPDQTVALPFRPKGDVSIALEPTSREPSGEATLAAQMSKLDVDSSRLLKPDIVEHHHTKITTAPELVSSDAESHRRIEGHVV